MGKKSKTLKIPKLEYMCIGPPSKPVFSSLKTQKNSLENKALSLSGFCGRSVS
jgi:hypothetical protein